MMEDAEENEHQVRNLVLSVCDLKQNGDGPSEKVLAQSCVLGTRLYLHGGCDARQIYDEIHLLEIEQMKWSEIPATGQKPSPRYGHSMSASGKNLVVFGGLCGGGDMLEGGGGALNIGITSDGFKHAGKVDDGRVYTFQTDTISWSASNEANPQVARYCHSATVCGALLVVFGGIGGADQKTLLNDVQIFDLNSGQWRPEVTAAISGDAPSPRFGHKAIYSEGDNSLLVFGGDESDTQLYSLDLGNCQWSVVSVQGTPPAARRHHSFDIVGPTRAFVFAGRTATSGVTDLYALNMEEKRWQRPLYDSQVNVRGHASAVLHDKLIVFGGCRDKRDKKDIVIEEKISRKLFFLNALEITAGVSEGDFKFKLVTIGDSGVGKSCLLTRFVQDFYSDFHVSTIGVDFKTVVTMVKGKLVKLQLWDTAGQERFSVVTGSYYRNSDGFIFVFDATNRTSFEHVDQWMEQVQQHHDCGPGTMKILVGNKCDLKDEIQISEAEAKAKAEQIGAIYMQTSAKTAANVDMAFLTGASQLVEMRKSQPAAQKAISSQGGGIGLTDSQPSNGAVRQNCQCGLK